MLSLSLPSSAHPRPFQRSRVRTSTPRYGGFTLSKDSSHGLRVQRKRLIAPCSDSLSLRIPLNSVMLAACVDSRTHYAKGKRSRPEGRFHSLWTYDFRSVSLRSQRFFSPFPHGTGSLSVIMEYLALESGLPGFGRGFTCPVLLGIPIGRTEGFRLRGSHPLWPLFPEGSAILARATARSRNPGRQAFRFGLVRVRSPLLAQSRLLSSPGGTEMFHFPPCRSSGTIFVHPAAAPG